MKIIKLFPLILLLSIPIVKADGCGIVCPKNPTDAMALALLIACNLVTWTICHWVSFFIVLVTLGLIYIFWWHNKGEDKKRKIKFTFLILGSVLFIALLYPYIRAWVTTNPSTGSICNTDSWGNPDTTTCTLIDAGSQTSSYNGCNINYCKLYCHSISSTECAITLTNNDTTVITDYNANCVSSGTEVLATMTNITSSYNIGLSFSDC